MLTAHKLFALTAAACGLLACGAPPPARTPPPAKPRAAPATQPAPAPAKKLSTEELCGQRCADFAVCWEEVNGGDFRGGSDCSMACEEAKPANRASWTRCIEQTADCKKMMSCTF